MPMGFFCQQLRAVESIRSVLVTYDTARPLDVTLVASTASAQGSRCIRDHPSQALTCNVALSRAQLGDACGFMGASKYTTLPFVSGSIRGPSASLHWRGARWVLLCS